MLRIRRGLRGFTLVESVVALAVLSLLMTAVLAALRAFGNTQESLQVVTGRVDEMRAVSSFLRESLEAGVVGRGGSGGGGLGFGSALEEGIGETAYFRGSESSFEWKARLVFGESYGGTFLVRVAREEDQLVFSWQRPPQSENDISWTGQQSRVLIPRMQEFTVDYRGMESSDWQPQWREQERPQLVRLAVKANNRYWPELIMAVQ